MRINNQIASTELGKVFNHKSRSISSLIDGGFLTDVVEGGFPIYTPIGNLILDNIEKVFNENALAAGFDVMRIPNAMKTSTLAKGQEIGKQFESKLMKLTGNLEGYHVISTPETLVIEWSKRYQMSYKQLPVRLQYTDELHRQMPYTKGSLITRQIRIFGGFSVERKDITGFHCGVEDVRGFSEKSFNDLQLPYHKEQDYNGFNYEFFYVTSNKQGVKEGENLVLPSISTENRTKGFSLGMVYNYPMSSDWAIRFRNERNKNETPALISFGICTTRVLYTLMMEHHDSKGFNLPKTVRPFDVYIIPEGEKDLDAANKLYTKLSSAFNDVSNIKKGAVALDDRIGKSVKYRIDTSNYVGAPIHIVIRGDHTTAFNRDGEKIFSSENQDETFNAIKSLNPV